MNSTLRPDKPAVPAMLLALLFLLVTACHPASAQARSVEEWVEEGRAALKDENYEAALSAYNRAAGESDDDDEKIRLGFFQGLALQQLAATLQAPRDENRRRAVLGRAAGFYRRLLEAHPDSAATANNLAKVYASLGEPDRAIEMYAQAIDEAEARRPIYQKNYAEFLEKTGRLEDASSVYGEMIREQSLSSAQQDRLIEHYRERNLDTLAGHLWNLIDAGHVRKAGDAAVDVLRQNTSEPIDLRTEFLTIVCVALSHDPLWMRDREFQAGLAALESDEEIKSGVREIGLLYSRKEFQPASYEWWGKREARETEAPRGMWPEDGFRLLVRSLGSKFVELARRMESRAEGAEAPARGRLQAQRDESLELAEAYYRLAADLQEEIVDPAAVRDLAQLFAAENQAGKITELLDKYTGPLFGEKGRMYQYSRDKKIFEYHQTLGELYAMVERWGDEGDSHSAIFQLDHARTTSSRLEQKLGAKTPRQYRFTPAMTNVLAEAYVGTGRENDAQRLRLSEADRYRQKGETRSMNQVLDQVDVQKVPNSLKRRYPDLESHLDRPPVRTHTRPETVSVAPQPPSNLVPTDVRTVDEPVRRPQASALTPAQIEQIQAALRQAQTVPGGLEVQRLEWQGLPGVPRRLRVAEEGKGVLTLELDGKMLEVEFPLVPDDVPAPVNDFMRTDHR